MIRTRTFAVRSVPLVCAVLGAFCAAVVLAAPARAIPRTFVSNAGSGSACTRAAPCADFQSAHDATDPGGEINCLNSGNYASATTVLINRSITIDCGRTSSTAVVSASFGFLISAVGITVRLRNLTIDGSGGGGTGIFFRNGAVLLVENCAVTNFSATNADGIAFFPLGPAKLFVINSLITNTNGPGIETFPFASNSAHVVLERVRLESNLFGLYVNVPGTNGSNVVQTRNSLLSNNRNHGVAVFSSAGGGVASVTLDRSASVLNLQDGVSANGPETFVVLANSTVMSNGTGLATSNGAGIFSYRDNRLTGNVSDGAPTAVLTAR